MPIMLQLSICAPKKTHMTPAAIPLQDDQGNVNWGVVIFSLLCIACGAVWLGLLRTWCALGSSCLSCPRKQQQVGLLLLSHCCLSFCLLHHAGCFEVGYCHAVQAGLLNGSSCHVF